MVMFIVFGLLFLASLGYMGVQSLRYATFRYYYHEVVAADPRYNFDDLIVEEKQRFNDLYDDGIPVLCVLGVMTAASYLLTLPLHFL